MKSRICRHVLPIAAGFGLLMAGQQAFALSSWGNLGTDCGTADTQSTLKTDPAVASKNCGSKDGVTLTADAFSTAPNTELTATFDTAYIYNWGQAYGLGVVNKNETTQTGPHAVDNYSGTDAIRLKFSSKVTLTSIDVGWVGTDSDLSLLAWTGPAQTEGQVKPLQLDTLANPAVGGWKLIGHYANMGTAVALTTTVSSSYWLVSAYNSAYGSSSDARLNDGNDKFKLLAVAGNKTPDTGQTPEPGSLVLLGVGLLGIMVSRRQKQSRLS